MNKVFLVIISFVILLIFSSFIFKITGFFVSNDVSIKDDLKGMITALNYKSSINISEFQNITVEFTDTGSLPMTARIEETIYFYNDTKLNPIAYYYDSYVNLKPGDRRYYHTVFSPPYYGTYYIKVRVPYETKVAETWGVFSVTYYVPPPPPNVIVVPPGGGGPITYLTTESGIPRLSLDYKNNYDLYPGQSLLISVNANNTGEVSLTNLKLSTSTTSLITTNVNPKVVSSLGVNKSELFLISLDTPKDIPLGVYPLDFEALSDNVREMGSISLNIKSMNISSKDDVYQTILNYDYLLNELEKKIAEAVSEGSDVSIAQRSFDRAKEDLKTAKDYYNSGDYDSAKDKLDAVKKDLEDVVFQLANSQLKIYVAPAFSPFIIIILAIIIAIVFLIVLKSRKRERKPKLLREVGEET